MFFIGLAAFFFFVYGRRKALRDVALTMSHVERGDSQVAASEARR
jgi:hypothetical protein